MKQARIPQWLSGLGAAGVLGLTITLVGRSLSAGTPAAAPAAVPGQALPPRPNGPQPPHGAQLTKDQVQALQAALTADHFRGVQTAIAAQDFSKGRIERPIKRLLAGPTAPAQLAAGKPAFVNPRVQPGKVRWHADLAAACAASQRSGKPVLLFSMMGRLDLQFC